MSADPAGGAFILGLGVGAMLAAKTDCPKLRRKVEAADANLANLEDRVAVLSAWVRDQYGDDSDQWTEVMEVSGVILKAREALAE